MNLKEGSRPADDSLDLVWAWEGDGAAGLAFENFSPMLPSLVMCEGGCTPMARDFFPFNRGGVLFRGLGLRF